MNCSVIFGKELGNVLRILDRPAERHRPAHRHLGPLAKSSRPSLRGLSRLARPFQQPMILTASSNEDFEVLRALVQI